MKNYLIALCIVFVLISCAEKLVERPDNLIPIDKMVSILKEMTIVNAAKSTNVTILKENGIEPTDYVFDKYEIDSTQFVDSDRYYASLPLVYEQIYEEVETLLDTEKTYLEEFKKVNDSLKLMERKGKKQSKTDTIKLSEKVKNALE